MTANSDTKVYNGQKQSVSGYTGAPEGADFSDIKVGATGKDANTYPATFPEGTVGTVDATGKYIVSEAINGSLTITKRPVTLTSATLSKEYDGTALVNGETPLAREEGWVDGEGANYKFTGSVTLPGATAPNAYTYTAKEGTDFNNYSISYNEGQLSITSKEAKYEVQVTVNSGNKVYDGEALTVSGFVGETENGIPVTADGKTYYVKGLSASATGSNVSDSTSVNATGTAQVVDEAGNDVTSEFKVTVNPGSLTITKRPVTLTSATLEKTYDGTALVNADAPNHGVTINENKLLVEEGWVDGEGATYTFDGTQTLVGSSNNKFSYELKKNTKAENYTITKTEGTLTVTDDDVDTDKVITKTHEGREFALGDTITFTIKVKNIYDKVKTITITEQEGVTITGESVFENVEPGEEVTTTAKYVVREQDILEQNFHNTATASFFGGKSFDGEDDATVEEVKPVFKATKVITEEQRNATFGVDDTVLFKIIVENTGNVTLNNVTVGEELEDATIKAGAGYRVDNNVATIASLAPKTTVVVYAEYTVKQTDVDDADLVNTAIVNAKDPEGKDLDSQKPSVNVPTDEKAPDMVAKKEIANPEAATGKDGKFKVGDTVEFNITVTNTGNVTLKGITVEEGLANAIIDNSAGYTVADNVATIASLAPNKSVAVKAHYVVTQEDIDLGKLTNVATVKEPGSDDPKKPVVPVPTEDPDPSYTVVKTLTNLEEATGTRTAEDGTETKAFKAGETAKFDITVKNTGNVTLSDIEVKDILAGAVLTADKGYDLTEAGVAKIAALAPEDEVVIKAEYVVTQTDVDNGGTQNTVTATGKNPGETSVDPDPIKPEPIPTEDQKPSYTVVKTLTNLGEATGTRTAEDGTETKAFKEGETAKFDITVKNTGNVTLSDIEVKDILAGAVLTADKGYDLTEAGVAKIAALAPEDEVVIKAEYVVTQTDVDNGGTQNTVTATGKNPGETSVDPDPIKPEPIPTEDQKPSYTVVKTLSNQDEATGTKTVNGQTVKAFKVGETAKFDIVVTNTGNVTLNDIVVTEGLADAKIVSGNGYKVVDGKAVIDKLSVGTDNAVTVKAEYEITQEDVENGEITNTVTAEAKDPGEKTVDPEPINPEPVPTEDKNPAIKITKVVSNTSADPDGYAEAEKIEYTIQAENIGNITLDNVVITDEMTGDKWEVGTLTPQNPFSEEYKTSYEVKQSDILIGTVTNTAEVQGTSRVAEERVEERQADLKELSVEPIKLTDNADDYTVQDSATVVSQTVKKSSALQVTKTVTSKGSTITVDGKDVTGYRVGDTIEYNIHVKNTGNLTLINVVVNDVPTLATGSPNGSIVIAPSTDNTYTVDGSKATIATLTPGAEVDIKASYLVMAGDGTLKGNKLSNAAFVTGTSPDKDNPQPGDSSKTDPAPIEPEPDEGNGAMEGSITVTKMITTSDGKTPKDGVDAVIKVGLYDNASFSGQPIKTNTITISRGTSGNTVFDELDNTAGTVYYVAELDENGKPIVGGSAHLKGYGVPSYSANCKAGINPTTTKDTAASIVNPLAADSTGNGDKNDNSNSSTTSNNSNTSTSTKAAKTGDNTNMMLYWMLLGMAILAGCVAVVYRKRKER